MKSKSNLTLLSVPAEGLHIGPFYHMRGGALAVMENNISSIVTSKGKKLQKE